MLRILPENLKLFFHGTPELNLVKLQISWKENKRSMFVMLRPALG